LRQNQDARIGRKEKIVPVEGLIVHCRPLGAAGRVLRQTSGALRRTEGNTPQLPPSSRIDLD
jgi:hypothetical protein